MRINVLVAAFYYRGAYYFRKKRRKILFKTEKDRREFDRNKLYYTDFQDKKLPAEHLAETNELFHRTILILKVLPLKFYRYDYSKS